MHRMGLILLLTTLAISNLTAQDYLRPEEKERTPQEKIDSMRIKYIDSLTYRQYLDGDFRALLETSKEALKEGIRFYYLNYRTAIAYYSMKDYVQAAAFYKKTLSETPDDQDLKAALYYSYLLSGQNENAAILARTMAPHTQAIVGYAPSKMDHILLSGGYLMNENKPESITAGGFDSLNQYQNMIFSSLGIGFRLTDRAKLKLGYQFYNTRFKRSAASAFIMEGDLSQHQLVAALEFFSPGDITWGFAGGYYNIESAEPTYVSANVPNGQSNGRLGNGNNLYNINTNVKRNTAFSVLTFFNKRFVYTIPEIALAYSNFGGINQFQAKGSLTYYPLGNLNFYGISAAAIVYSPDGWTKEQYIFSQHFGVKLFDPVWLDANVSLGNHLNYISERSFVVYDTYDSIKGLAGLTLSWYLKNTMLSAGYQWQQKEGYAFSKSNYTTYKYNNHLINIALLWNF